MKNKIIFSKALSFICFLACFYSFIEILYSISIFFGLTSEPEFLKSILKPFENRTAMWLLFLLEKVIILVYFYLFGRIFLLFGTDGLRFENKTLKQLKILSYFNILIIILGFMNLIWIAQYLSNFNPESKLRFQYDIFAKIKELFWAVIVIYFVDYFKKGYEIQTENDLTI